MSLKLFFNGVPIAPKCVICNTYGEGEKTDKNPRTVINMVGDMCWPCVDKAKQQYRERMVVND